jgi:hypothetical protein
MEAVLSSKIQVKFYRNAHPKQAVYSVTAEGYSNQDYPVLRSIMDIFKFRANLLVQFV